MRIGDLMYRDTAYRAVVIFSGSRVVMGCCGEQQRD